MGSWSPRLLVFAALASFAGLVVLVGGCAKVRQARQAVNTARSAGELAQMGKASSAQERGSKLDVQVHRKKEGEGTWSMTDAKGNKSTATVSLNVTEEDVGLKFYPGATVKTGTTISGTGAKGGPMVTATLTTKDDFGKVAKFYKDNYAKGNQAMEAPDSLTIRIGSGEAAKRVSVNKDRESGEVTIVLTAGAGT